jgi:acyl-CoA reductase-like NAD-dependent aldehyde dehydrogenase
LQVLPSQSRVAEKYVADERLKALSFTGSAAVGWRLKGLAGRKKVILELGGNAACIVDRDADLELAAARITIGAFYHAGQVCIATKRLLVHRDVYQAFREVFLRTLQEKAVAGDPRREETLVGPFIDAGAAARVRECVEEALNAGARLAAGGLGQGNLMPATVLEEVGRDLKVWQEEVFGPVVAMAPFAEFSEALELANDSIYGLQAGVFTRTLAHAWQAFETLEVGGVIINEVPAFRVDNMPYGGVKASGFGREGLRYAVEELTELRLLALHG